MFWDNWAYRGMKWWLKIIKIHLFGVIDSDKFADLSCLTYKIYENGLGFIGSAVSTFA